MRKTVVYSKKHADSIRSIENPFSRPQELGDYALSDYIQQVTFEIIEKIESSVDPGRREVTSLEIQQCLKEVPDKILDFAQKKMSESSLTGSEEAKVMEWMLLMAGALDIDEASVNFYWQKAKARRILEIY